MDQVRMELLTIDELAQRLKVRKSWLYSRTRQKGHDAIPAIRVGKYVRFDEAKVMEWLKGKQDADQETHSKGNHSFALPCLHQEQT